MLVTRDKTERPRGALLQPDIEFGYGLYRIGGSLRNRSASFGGDIGGIPLWPYRDSNSPPSSGGRTVSGRQFDWGGRLLKGNGGAPRFPQRGRKSRFQSAKAEGSLTARPTSRAGTKVGLSDPVVPCGWAIAQRIKATPGITGLSPPRVHIDGEVWHLDVGSSHPGAEVGPKGWAVRPLKRYASWVQNVVRQFGPYLSRAQEI
jgi:hypothetical protein